MKKNYTISEFNSLAGIGCYLIERNIAEAKRQGVEITDLEAAKIERIENICFGNRLLSQRFKVLRDIDLYPVTCPMHTGYGVGRCIKRMKDGSLRIRVAANYGIKKGGNYAYCVHI